MSRRKRRRDVRAREDLITTVDEAPRGVEEVAAGEEASVARAATASTTGEAGVTDGVLRSRCSVKGVPSSEGIWEILTMP